MVPTATPSPDRAADKPPRPKRWIPVSLRMFMVMLVMIGGGGAFWVGVPAYRQVTTIREIERVGGQVDLRQGGPGWLRERVGDERMTPFDEVYGVEISTTEEAVAILGHLTALTRLEILSLDNRHVTDSNLKPLIEFPHLQSLSLCGTQVTDAGLEALKQLPAINGLSLDDTPVTDAGIERMAGMATLRYLDLRGVKITDAGLAYLRDLPALEGLGLSRTPISDAGLEQLLAVKKLRSLSLNDTQITDAAITHLKRLTGLTWLEVARTEITNAGLEQQAIRGRFESLRRFQFALT